MPYATTLHFYINDAYVQLWGFFFFFFFRLLLNLFQHLRMMHMLIVFHVEQALHEALMRQEELLAYIDRQEEAKLQVS